MHCTRRQVTAHWLARASHPLDDLFLGHAANPARGQNQNVDRLEPAQRATIVSEIGPQVEPLFSPWQAAVASEDAASAAGGLVQVDQFRFSANV